MKSVQDKDNKIKELPTKVRILHAALSLFAEKGYDGVGVDLIAEKAGIKGPSLYRHYKGKEDILDALFAMGEVHYEENFGSGARPGMIPMTEEELAASTLGRIRFTMHDPMIRQFRKIMMMEQFRNPKIAKVTTKHHLIAQAQLQETIFREMMDRGVMKKDDPGILALEFTAPITVLLHTCDREPDLEDEIMEKVESFIRHFAREYMIKE